MSDAGSFNGEANLSLNLNFSNTGLKDIKDTLKEIAEGKDLQHYWKDVESATDDATRAIKKYSKNVESKNLASDFLKQINAIRALTKKENLSEIFPNIDVDFEDLVIKARAIAPQVASAFSKDVFEQAFRSFQILKDEGVELFDVFDKLADYSHVVSKNFELRNKNKSLESLFGDSDIEKLKKNEKEIRKLRQEAEETFETFLKLNKIERTDYWGNENFSEFFDDIKDGTLTATEAIARFKTQYGYLLEESFKSSNNTFGLDQLQEFSDKLDSIFHQVEETSNKINSIIENGIIAKSVQNLSEDTSLSDSQRSLFGDLLKDEESLKSITDLVKRLIDESQKTKNTDVFNEGQFEEIKKLFQNIEQSLSAIKGVLVDVGDGEELSPLLKKLEEIREVTDGIKLKFNMNIDFGSNSEFDAEFQKKQVVLLSSYENLFKNLFGHNAPFADQLYDFINNGINQYTTVAEKIAGYETSLNQLRKQSMIVYGEDLFSNKAYKKYFNQVSSAKRSLTMFKNANNGDGDGDVLDNLFGSKEELSTIIRKLGEISKKLNEISTAAKTFSDNFSQRLNIAVSIDEVETLTQKVRDLEDELAKVKAVVPTNPVDIPTSVPEPQVENNNQGDAVENILNPTSETNISSGSNLVVEQQNELQEELKETRKEVEKTKSSMSGLSNIKGLKHYTDEVFDKFDNNMFGSGIGENRLGEAAYFFDEKNSGDWSDIGEYSKYLTTWSANQIKLFDQTIGFTEEQINQIIKEFYSDVDEGIQEDYKFDLKNIMDDDLYEFKSKFGIKLQDVMKFLGYDAIKTNSGEYAFYNTDKLVREVQVYDQEANKIIDINNKVVESIKETSTNPMKDAFQGETGSGNVTEIREDLQEVIPVENQVAENFQEIRQETDKAVESAKKYGNILSQIGLVGAQYNDKGEQIPSRYSYVQQTGEKQVQTVTVKYEKDNETGEIIKSKPIFGDYITGFQALEKEIDKADKKVVDLKKNLELNKLKLGDNYDSSSQEQLIDEAEKYANLLYGALEAYDRQSDYEYSIAQYAEERAKKQANYNTQLQNALKIEQARTKNASDKKDVADEQKRQKNIEQTNRLLNRQQITINGIAKSYNKMANPDLDKAVENPDDLKQLAKKKQEIQGLINKLSGQERNSSNEKEFLQIEKLIAEYKQLAKDKLKANNPSKQQLGGENLKSLLENQVSQYNKLIAQSEKYGSVTEEITTELKKQRDLIAEQDKNGVYRARFTKADGSKLTADDYYEARDSYKINKSVLESYKTDSPELKKQIATYNELITTIEKYKSSATLIAKGNGTDELDAEVATLQVRIEELQNSPILSKEQLQSARDMLEKIEDKLIEIQGTTAVTATKKAEDALPSYSNTLQSYEKSIKKLQDGGWASPTFVSNVNAIKTALDNYKNAIVEVKQKTADGIATQEDVDKLNRYKLALEDAINTTKGMSSSEKGYTFLAGQKELDKINKILKENSAMSKEAKKQIRAYYDQIKYGDPSASLETIHGEIMEIVNAEVEAGRGGKSLLGVIKDKAWYGLASQIGMYFGLNDFIRYIREGIDVVTELDTALTEMRKVSDETVTSLKAYQETTFDVADAVGTTAVQIQNSTADFMRLGESMDEAAESAKTANILMNVSEFESIDDATSALTSMAQAYQDLDKMTIVDKLNEVGKIIAQTYSNVWCYKNIAW